MSEKEKLNMALDDVIKLSKNRGQNREGFRGGKKGNRRGGNRGRGQPQGRRIGGNRFGKSFKKRPNFSRNNNNKVPIFSNSKVSFA